MYNLILKILMSQLISSNTLIETPTAYFPKAISFWEGGFTTSFALKSVQEEFEPHPYDFDLFVQGVFNSKYSVTLKIYTLREIGLDFSYQIIDEIGNIPAIAFGLRNITYKKYINPAGGEPPEGGFKDENYEHRNPEILSLYLVSTKKLAERFIINAGIGRGEFIGYGPRSKYLNLDIFSKDFHDWTFGIFGGIKFLITNYLSANLEADGRDFNFGIRFEREMFQFTIQTNKLEHIFWGSKTYPLSPRLTASLSINSGIAPPKPTPVYVKFEIYDNEIKVPIKGVRITFLETGMLPMYTDDNGIVGREIMPGNYLVKIEKEGYKKITARLNISKERETFVARIYLTPLVLRKEICERYIRNAREYKEKGNYIEAKRNYELALNTLPDYPNLKNEYENFLNEFKMKIEGFRAKAIDYENRGDFQRAISSWQEVLRIDPENEEAKAKISELTEKMTKPKVVEKKPEVKKPEKPAYTKEDIEKMLNTAISEYNNKNYKKAKEILQKILAIDPNNAKAKEYLDKTEKRLKLLEK
jgi:tetratricopeptide (TPR) repeat protein